MRVCLFSYTYSYLVLFLSTWLFFSSLFSLSLALSLGSLSSLPISILVYSDTPPFLLSFTFSFFSSLTCSTLSSFLPFLLCLFVSVSLSRFSLQFFSLCLFVDVGDEEEAGPLCRFQNSRERCKFLAPSISVSVPEDDPYHSDEEYYEHPLFSPEWTRSGSRPPGQAAAFRQIEGEPRMVPLCHSLLPSSSFLSLLPSTSFFSSASTPLSFTLALSLWSASSCLLSPLCRAHSDRSVSCGGGFCFCTLFMASHLDFAQLLCHEVKWHVHSCF